MYLKLQWFVMVCWDGGFLPPQLFCGLFTHASARNGLHARLREYVQSKITESMTYLARHEALWVQWRDGRMGAVVRGIEVPAPTVPAARRLVRLVSHPTRGPCQVCRRQVSPASILYL